MQSKQRSTVETQTVKCQKETKFQAKVFLKGIAREIGENQGRRVSRKSRKENVPKTGNYPTYQSILTKNGLLNLTIWNP